jgi:hypothetical protein
MNAHHADHQHHFCHAACRARAASRRSAGSSSPDGRTSQPEEPHSRVLGGNRRKLPEVLSAVRRSFGHRSRPATVRSSTCRCRTMILPTASSAVLGGSTTTLDQVFWKARARVLSSIHSSEFTQVSPCGLTLQQFPGVSPEKSLPGPRDDEMISFRERYVWTRRRSPEWSRIWRRSSVLRETSARRWSAVDCCCRMLLSG